MAVPKRKKSKSKKHMRRSHNGLDIKQNLSTDKVTGELHLRHNISKTGYYKGKKVINIKKNKL